MSDRFRRRFNLDTSLPQTGASAAFTSIADSFQRFSSVAAGFVAAESEAQAKRDAGQVEPSTESPELRSPSTVYGQNYNSIVLQGHLAATQNAYRSQLAKIANENASNPTAFSSSANKVRGEILNQIAPQIKGAVANDIDRISNSLLLDIQKQQNKETLLSAKQETELAFDSIQANISRYLRQGDEVSAVEEAQLAKSIISDSQVLSLDEKADRLKAIDNNVVEQSLLNDLEELEIGEAWSLLSESSQNIPKTHSAEEWDDFIKKAQTQLNRREKRDAEMLSSSIKDNARLISDLEVDINSDAGDMVDQVNTVNKLFEKDFITKEKRTSLLTKINNRSKKSVDSLIDIQSVMKRLEGDDSVIVENSVADKVYKEHILPEIPEATGNAHKALFVERMKYVPKQMEQEIKNGLRSGNVELIKQSSDLIDRISEIPGATGLALSTEDKAFSSVVQSFIQYLDPEEAIALATKNTDPADRARIEMRRSVLDQKTKAKRQEGYLDEAEDRFDFQFFGTSVDEISAGQLSKDFGELAEQYFIAGMDMNDAKNQAEEDMKRIWGASIATGETRTMKYPVELFYGAGDNKWIEKQLKKEVKEKWPFEFDEIFLKSDDITAREATKGNPSYLVVVKDENGLTPLVKWRWHPDRDAATKEIIKTQTADFEEERKFRQGIIQREAAFIKKRQNRNEKEFNRLREAINAPDRD